MGAKKRCTLIKSSIITSKQRCANTRNRLLVTRSLLRDTENVNIPSISRICRFASAMEKKGRATAQASHGKIEQRKEV